MIFHCFFEQSGTFKNEFKKLGFESYDYDILDDYGQTDFVVDLFSEIENCYNGESSIFDKISINDMILAFFPCIRFEDQILLGFRGQLYQQKNWTLRKKMEYDLKLMDELKHYYDLVNKLFIICIDNGFKLVMENPYSESHFLRRYWCFSPAIIDKDRRDSGDYFAKPTQYWFIGFEPYQNLIFEPISYNHLGTFDSIKAMKSFDYKKTGAKNRTAARSMIHPEYANRFIRQYLIEQK